MRLDPYQNRCHIRFRSWKRTNFVNRSARGLNPLHESPALLVKVLGQGLYRHLIIYSLSWISHWKGIILFLGSGCRGGHSIDLQQNRQRCTVRQDFESPLCISDQLRLRSKRSQLPTAQVTSVAAELGCRALISIELVYEFLKNFKRGFLTN